jgi:aerobic-type carbon monoxide dehydrogenase small subunit (CoxS/CutS family)
LTAPRRTLRCSVNGVERTAEVTPRLLLSDFLRHDLGLTGTHVGCEHGVCGACTVVMDGTAVRSCLILAVQVDGSDIRTVESLTNADDSLSAIPAAFRDAHGLQCGFCTPGIMMSLAALAGEVEGTASAIADETAIADAIAGHLCRCTGYRNIVRAATHALGPVEQEHADG